MPMKRTNFFFPEQMLKRIRTESKKTGLSISELIRRAVEEYLVRMAR